ncbi:hypothetical protein [Legionella cincinnatiensis]|uniref:Uncharacterized protein n=1 Tax=Legionella cincinnatiensis TaxID=28085 RepID=A0A378IG49_9GAMM|nr:hypothetical protein [Legionella cincinnatiensis]KTC82797.1 hypothetical protein Lcin_2826 [Legionella cincinnatiensis]STX34228.1 Uncharacterised protein [Legionella cincinnatiensis]
MDSIQLALDVHVQGTNKYKRSSLLKKHHISEAGCPLLVSYLTWIRKINGSLNKTDEIHQNEQIHNEFKFLCKHNLLFFLTVTRQFDVIEKLFSTPSFTTRLHHSITCIKNAQNNVKQIKKKRLLQLIHQQNNKLASLLEKKHHVPIDSLHHCLHYFIHFAKKNLITNVPMQDTDVMDYALTAFKFFVENLKKRNNFNHERGVLENSAHPKEKPHSSHKSFLVHQHSTFFSSTEQSKKEREIQFRPTVNIFQKGHVLF